MVTPSIYWRSPVKIWYTPDQGQLRHAYEEAIFIIMYVQMMNHKPWVSDCICKSLTLGILGMTQITSYGIAIYLCTLVDGATRKPDVV